MNILILGVGVQGTLYGLRLARAGHDVTLIARGERAKELREHGASIQEAVSGLSDMLQLPVEETIHPDTRADACFVMVRREQLDALLPMLSALHGISRFVFMVNHANGSERLVSALGRERVALGFPGAGGSLDNGVVRFMETAEQPTAIDTSAPEISEALRMAGFKVKTVRDMDSWLRRHAVFVTGVGGALYEVGCDPVRLASQASLIRTIILAVREGWKALDRRGVAPEPLGLRMIFRCVPMPFAIAYWRRLFRSPRGEYYFARHTRRAVTEMAALSADVLSLLEDASAPNLRRLYDAIATAATSMTKRD